MTTATAQAKHAKPGAFATEDEATAARRTIDAYLDISGKVTKVLLSVGIGALIFTMINVTRFAMDHHTPMYIAILLDPMVSIALVATLYIDGRLLELGDYKPGFWPLVLRYFAFLSTWLMNIWTSLYPDNGGAFTGIPVNPDHAGLLLHSVPPFLVFVLAEAVSIYRKQIAEKIGRMQGIIDSHAEGVRAAKRAKAEADAAEEREREEQFREQMKDRKAAEEREHERKAGLEKARLAVEAEERRAELRREEAEHAAKLRREEAEHKLALQFKTEEKQREAQAQEAERLRLEAEEEAARETERLRLEAEEEAAREAEAAAEKERKAAEREARRIVRQAGHQDRHTAGTTGEDQEDEHGQVVQMSREERRQHKERAVEHAATLILAEELTHGSDADFPMTTTAFGERHGKASTWGRERIAEARQRLAEDKEFADRMEMIALEETVKKEELVHVG